MPQEIKEKAPRRKEHNIPEESIRERNPAASILGADLLVVDKLIALPTPDDLARDSASLQDKYRRLSGLLNRLLAEKGKKPGGKISIDADEFRELSLAAAGLPSRMEPGGSTADILTTVKHLRGDSVNIGMIGIAGRENLSDDVITNDLRKNGIALIPGATEGAHAAISFIFRHPDGTHTNVTYPGNAAQKLDSDVVTDKQIAKSDTVLIPLSLWSKFDAGLPEALLAKSWEQDKTIILTIPKQARFNYGGPEDIHRKTIPRADIIVADEEELARLYKTGGDYEAAIKLLQADMKKHDAARAEAGKPPRDKPATALIKHKDDGVTVLVAESSPAVPPARYELAPPPALSGRKHSLGVDDAIYAGFIAAINEGVTPSKAAEFAMRVAQTKFLYDSPRIPGPDGAAKATQEHWKNLNNGLDNLIAGVESAIGYARTGVDNPSGNNQPRTTGQKFFDLGLYPLLANVGVWALSMFATYHSNFNQNKANWFVARSDWFKGQLAKLPMLGKSPSMVKNLNMIIWSFVDGSLMAPVVAAFESKRQPISRGIDSALGTTPADPAVYDKEVKRSWKDVLKARAATFALVIATYFTLSTEFFKHSAREGILTETPPGSGEYARSKVQSINGFVFDLPGKAIGGALMGVDRIRNWAQNISGSQLRKMAEKTDTVAREATAMDARYQLEGLAVTGLFELVYTSLCTAGLFFIGKTFASHHKHKHAGAETPVPAAPIAVAVPTTHEETEAPATRTWVYKSPARPGAKQEDSPRSSHAQSILLRRDASPQPTPLF